MSSPHPSARARARGAAAVVALATAFLAAAPPAGAAGFGRPRAVSPLTDVAADPQVAVSPNGRTAVLWEQFDRRYEHGRYVVAFGRDAGHLARARTVRAAEPAATSNGDASLLALPGGRFASCLRHVRRDRHVVLGCAFASPKGAFGREHVVLTRPGREIPTLLAVGRPDGSLALLTVRRVAPGRRALRGYVMRPSGRVSSSQSLGTVLTPVDAGVDLAAAADGTVAATWTAAVGDRYSGSSTPVLRLMAPGQERFGPPVPFTPEATIGTDLLVQGGRELLLRYGPRFGEADAETRVIRRRADGTFDAPLRLPAASRDDPYGTLVQLRDGTPLAITASVHQRETDCEDVDRSVVGAGPLVPPGAGITAARLSAPGQIAQDPVAGVLSDGTVVAAWGDSAGDGSRLEVAVRSPGATAFGAARPLPWLVARDYALATGGDQAVLAWLTGDRLMGPAHVVVSALRRTGPYARPAPRPAHPSAPCS